MKADQRTLKVRVLPKGVYRMVFRVAENELHDLINRIPAVHLRRETGLASSWVAVAILDSDWSWLFMKAATVLGYEVEVSFNG